VKREKENLQTLEASSSFEKGVGKLAHPSSSPCPFFGSSSSRGSLCPSFHPLKSVDVQACQAGRVGGVKGERFSNKSFVSITRMTRD